MPRNEPSSLSASSATAFLLLVLAPACSGSVETATGGSSTATTTPATTPPAGPAPASVRFANLSTALPAFDVCQGAGAALLAADGLSSGLALGQVSRYLPADPSAGPWVMVPAGGSCADPSALPLPITWPAGSEKGRVTIVPWLTTDGGPGVTSAYAFVDEPGNDQYGINLRVLDFIGWPSGIGGPTLYVEHHGPDDLQPVTLFSGLKFGAVPEVSSLGAVTAAGFVHTPYVAVGDLMVVPDLYTAPMLLPGPVPIPGGEGNAYGVGSIFLAGGFTGGSARAVVCADDAPAEGALSSCTLLTQATP